MSRVLVASSSPFATAMCFSRAVKVGNFISVGGTAPINDKGETVGVGDPKAQTIQCLKTIELALQDAGATLKDVIRTRMMLTNIEHWKDIAQVRAEYFKDIRPVDTVVQVSGFINPQWLIEVDAIINQ